MQIYQVDYHVKLRPCSFRTGAMSEAQAIAKAREFLASRGIDGRDLAATDVTESAREFVKDVAASVAAVDASEFTADGEDPALEQEPGHYTRTLEGRMKRLFLDHPVGLLPPPPRMSADMEFAAEGARLGIPPQFIAAELVARHSPPALDSIPSGAAGQFFTRSDYDMTLTALAKTVSPWGIAWYRVDEDVEHHMVRVHVRHRLRNLHRPARRLAIETELQEAIDYGRSAWIKVEVVASYVPLWMRRKP